MADNPHAQSEARSALIFAWLIYAQSEDKLAVLSYLREVAPSQSILGRFSGPMSDYMAKHSQPPTPEFMVASWGFPGVIDAASVAYAQRMTLSDMQEVVESEMAYLKKVELFQRVMSSMDTAHQKDSTEIVTEVESALTDFRGGSTAHKAPAPLWEIYKKSKGGSIGALTFVGPVDDVLVGLEFGNLMTVAGFAGSGGR